jgi:hypothetical protein
MPCLHDKIWRDVLDAEVLTARLIAFAGFPACQIGGFALSAAMRAFRPLGRRFRDACRQVYRRSR